MIFEEIRPIIPGDELRMIKMAQKGGKERLGLKIVYSG